MNVPDEDLNNQICSLKTKVCHIIVGPVLARFSSLRVERLIQSVVIAIACENVWIRYLIEALLEF